MIKRIEFNENDTLGFEAVGEVSREDYNELIRPTFEKARADGTKLRFLFYLGPEFKGFTPGAAWEDFKLGLRYLRMIDRCAVVSDNNWVLRSSRLVGSLVPCPVKVFKNEELHNAKAWLASGEIGLDHHLDENTGLLSVEVTGPLSSENMDILTNTVDSWLERNHELNGIAIRSKSFPGWDNVGSFISHFRFVKDHHRKIKRVALVVDGLVANTVPQIAKHFVKAEVKHFDYDQMDEAKKWVLEAATEKSEKKVS